MKAGHHIITLCTLDLYFCRFILLRLTVFVLWDVFLGCFWSSLEITAEKQNIRGGLTRLEHICVFDRGGEKGSVSTGGGIHPR